MWHKVKQVIKSSTGLEDLGLHVLFGLLIFFVLLCIIRRPWFSFAGLIAICLINEMVDISENLTSSGFDGAVVDTLFTLAGPLCIALIMAKVSTARR